MQNSSGADSESYTLSASGSLVYAGGFYGLSRPVSDSFGIVMLDKLPGAMVLNNGQEIGKTGPSGMMVVPTLASYSQNEITLDVKNIPMEYSVSGVNKALSPSLWSGSCVAFDAAKIQALTGSLFATQDKTKKPVEYQEGTIVVGAQSVEFLTGKGGEFYIENTLPKETKEAPDQLSCRSIAERRAVAGKAIKPGTYPAFIDYDGKKCEFEVVFPETEDVITDVGEVGCMVSGKVGESAPLTKTPEQAASLAQKPEPKEYTFVVKPVFDKKGSPALKKDRKTFTGIVRLLKSDPELVVMVEVYGDRHGSHKTSKRVGMKNANAIRKYLIRAGINGSRIVRVESNGNKALICRKPTAACDKINRRGVIRIVQDVSKAEAQGVSSKKTVQ
jgi:outer membrane protein OmpA-like peptidoglycan-associated protein